MKLLISFVALILTACGHPPTAEEVWRGSQQSRCWAAGGEIWFDRDRHAAECWRHTIWMRSAKLLFRETYRLN